jgi:hypothetical protein
MAAGEMGVRWVTAPRKVSMNLTPQAIEAAQEVADKRGMNRTDAVQRGLALQRYLEEVDTKKGSIFVELPDGTRERVILDW